ncbi:EDD domain protein, DegV family [Anaerosphaera aminiphila DSM 21120]|uniref:EDD domain protein, DegV family n=1 Tax=Anaerosphaera aminiphila DSM 21120 TaxID=1120995 RepID=A0A1M5PI88_9FIRM|nr:DegV family protein [Anaerosphaera aminiphila]SHH01219.1 EDD domain protein, DegV family [Anaerosphaera aminiphila DSM 21120]
MIRIVTDSASDITIKEAKSLNIDIVPLTITFDDEICPQNTLEDFDTFFNKLKTTSILPVTSQPSPELYLNVFNEAKSKEEDVLVITLSSGLSGTLNSALLAKKMSNYEKIYILDSKQAILTQRMLVEYAVKLRDENKSIDEIAKTLENLKDKLVVCGVLDTLKYLKMSGRIPSSLAFVGELLNIKPVVILKDSVLKELGKSRGTKSGINLMYKQFEESEINFDFPVNFGYTLDKDKGLEFMNETISKYNLKNTNLYPIGGVIGTHVGPHCLAIAFARK